MYANVPDEDDGAVPEVEPLYATTLLPLNRIKSGKEQHSKSNRAYDVDDELTQPLGDAFVFSGSTNVSNP